MEEKRVYEPPVLGVIDLAADEVMSFGCKIDVQSAVDGSCWVNMGCSTPGS